jgi:hypothetical protein
MLSSVAFDVRFTHSEYEITVPAVCGLYVDVILSSTPSNVVAASAESETRRLVAPPIVTLPAAVPVRLLPDESVPPDAPSRQYNAGDLVRTRAE